MHCHVVIPRLRKSWAEPDLERRVSEDASFGLSGFSDPLHEETLSDNESTTPPALNISSPVENNSLYDNGQLSWCLYPHVLPTCRTLFVCLLAVLWPASKYSTIY